MTVPAGHYRRAPRRLPQSVYWRRRLSLLVAIVLVVGGAYAAYHALAGGGSSGGGRSTTGTTLPSKPSGPPQLVVSETSWALPAALSRAVALPDGSSIEVLGGLTGTGTATSSAVTRIDPSNGNAQQVGTLSVPVHDAAGAQIGGKDLVFGGGAADLTADVQSVPIAATPSSSSSTSGQHTAGTTTTTTTAAPSVTSSVVGQLPALRADLASAVGPDGTVYLVGGYDGSAFSPAILSTKDGVHFSVVAQLITPVRYPAVAVAGGKLWVVGGEPSATVTTSSAVQVVDLTSHAVTAGAAFPVPIGHAGAAVMNGDVYVFGGRSPQGVVDDIWELNPGAAAPSFSQVGTLNVPVSDMATVDVAGTVYLVGGEGQLGQPSQSVGVLRMISGPVPNAPGILGPVFTGHLLIADRGNNRLLLVDTQKNISWTFPDTTHPAPPQGFFYPDDAFFAKGGTAIITNEEDQDTIIEISYPSGSLIASYGHPNVPGRATGYLDQPDDAYLLKDGSVVVADALNCRILFLNPDFTYKSEIGTSSCVHNIPTSVGYPNGDTPLADGNILVSEINGSYVDELTPTGQVVWSYKMPIAYPSDPQQLGPDLYLVADYTSPGGLYEFTREGQITWSYHATSAEGTLNHPSLAEVLPNGLICVNDDYRDRVVIIDPTDDQIVWQDGRTDQPGTQVGQLQIPDGFDLLAPDGTTPTHPSTG